MTRFTHFFIDRPIFAAVLSIVITLIGALALIRLPIAQYPEIAPPSVVVVANYPGASAAVLGETVATPIEQEVNGVEDMLYMSSQSTNDGTMQLTVTFRPGANLDKAQLLVQNRVALAEPRLPEEVRRLGISIRKRSPDLSLVVNLVSPDGRYDSTYMSNYALLQIKDTLARLPGVGDITLFGAREYSMRIWLDPDKIATRGLTAGEVVLAIREQNVQVAAGSVGQPPVPSGTDFQYTVTTSGRLSDEGEFGGIIIKTGRSGEITRLRDVARIELGSKDYTSALYLDGKPTVGLVVFQLPGSNALDTKDAVVNAMTTLKARFPEGLDYRIVYDTTVFIRESIHAVVKTLFEAMVLVVLVVLIFLQNWRATLIPTLAVPVSLIGTFAVMLWLGLSLNTLSLFGLVLAIGIVVDDAIVVVENVERNIALGLNAREATRKAMDEVVSPVVATAVVLVAVFMPTLFISGLSGAFYKQFALTISVSTVISAFNSLTLSPALCALLLQRHDKKDGLTRLLDNSLGWFFRGFDRIFAFLDVRYHATVQRLIRFSAVALVGYVALNGLNVALFTHVPTGFIPQQDQGFFIVYAQLPDAASLERTNATVLRATQMIMETEGVSHINSYAGFSIISGTTQSNAGTLFARLTPFEERKDNPELSADAVIAKLRAKLSQIEDGYVTVFAPPPLRGLSAVGGFKVQIQDRSGAGFDELQSGVQQVISQAMAGSQFVGLLSSFRANVPQVFLNLDRTKVKSHDISIGDVFATLQIYMGSLYINDFNRFGRTFHVVAQADSEFRALPEDIARLATRNRKGERVPLGSLMDIHEITAPDRVMHYNLYPSAEISGNQIPGVSSGQAIRMMEDILKQTLPRTLGFEWTELSLQEVLAGNTTAFVFPLCVVFVFLALAAQYESWALPLAIILIVPMCLMSSMTGIWLRGMDNNIFTQIGFIVLVGLACKNAILIVEFARRLEREQGYSRFTAAAEAARLRLRPILMTSLAFVMGVFPLMVSTGAGAESRRFLGTAMFSGMLGVTVFGLLLTPVFYVVVQGWVARLKGKRGGQGNAL
jgi:hydrophobe/amphiphile efflux-1 (HAE1) family protein